MVTIENDDEGNHTTLRLHEANIPELVPRQARLPNGDVVLSSDLPIDAVIGADLNSHTVATSYFNEGVIAKGSVSYHQDFTLFGGKQRA